MFNILKISEAASLALHTMVLLAQKPDKTLRCNEIAGILNGSKDHLAKVLKRLEKAGFVKSTRGPKGGFRLGRKSEDIKLIEIYEAIEGPYSPGRCLLGNPICKGEGCIFGDLKSIEKLLKDHLYNTKLSDLLYLCINSGGED